MSFSLKRELFPRKRPRIFLPLNPLFHELFSETWGSVGIKALLVLFSQSSFSWAFLWNSGFYMVSTDELRAISQSSFSWAFLWNVAEMSQRGDLVAYPLSILFFMSFSLKQRKQKLVTRDAGITLNPLFHELFSETWRNRARLEVCRVRLSILFFMSFSLKQKLGYKSIAQLVSSQSSFSWAFLWNWVSRGFVGVWERINSQSSFSWAFLWNINFYDKSAVRYTKVSQSSFSWAFLWNEQEKGGVFDEDSSLSQSSFSWAFLWNKIKKQKVPPLRQIILSILFFMSFSLKQNQKIKFPKLKTKSLNPLFHELFSETDKRSWGRDDCC